MFVSRQAIAERISNIRYARSDSMKVEFDFDGRTIAFTPPADVLLVETGGEAAANYIVGRFGFLLGILAE